MMGTYEAQNAAKVITLGRAQDFETSTVHTVLESLILSSHLV